MQQKVPDISLVAREGDMTCEECGEEVTFLVGDKEQFDGKRRCTDCFKVQRPEYSDAVSDFAEILELMLELKSKMMSLDEMYELYGNEEETSES